MQVLSTRDFKSFKALAQMTQPKLHSAVYKMLCAIYPKDKVRITKDVVCAEGDIPICLVAHMDTVFAEPPHEIYYDREANVMWSPYGLGADDRAGVFSIFKILAAGYRPHIVFTTDEERGVIGAGKFAAEPCPFKELKYVIELDRAYAMDCVFYDDINDEFHEYVESFGFVTAPGTFTDIVELCPAWGVSGVNLSIGYRNEHSVSETLFVGYMLATIAKVEKMLDDADNAKRYDFTSIYGNDYICTCAKCGKTGTTRLMIPVIDQNQKRVWICNDCLGDTEIDWCDYCYEGFLPGIVNEDGLCPKCAEKLKEQANELFGYPTNSGTIRQGDRVEPGVYFKWDEDAF